MTVKEREQVIDQARVRLIAGNGGLEDVRGADPLHAPERLFLLQPVDHRPYGSECRSSLLGQGLVDLANGTGAARPEHLHDAELEPTQRRAARHTSTTIVADVRSEERRVGKECR